MKTNVLYLGDNLEVMRSMESESIDLIYIDPPFFTQSVRKLGSVQFNDKWKGGIESYVQWMIPKLKECHRILKNQGTFFIHLDYRTSHYIKISLDKIFGIRNFRNEIIWMRDAAGKGAKKSSFQLSREVDNILFYSKSFSKWIYKQPYFSYLSSIQLKEFRYLEKKTKRRYKIVNLGDYSKRSIEKMKVNNLIHTTRSGKEYKKYYLFEFKLAIGSLWNDISNLSRGKNKERLGYPTQKPIKLLNRIIRMSSNKNDLVADFFSGSGTTISSAESLGRRWIGVDSNEDAIEITKKRMKRDHNLDIEVIRM